MASATYRLSREDFAMNEAFTYRDRTAVETLRRHGLHGDEYPWPCIPLERPEPREDPLNINDGFDATDGKWDRYAI